MNSASLIVDGAALYAHISHLNRGQPRRNRARVDYAKMLETISTVVPIHEALIAVTRDFQNARQQSFVDSLKEAGYFVDEVPFDSRPNTSAPLSVTVARHMGLKHGDPIVLVTNDVYLYPAMLAHINDNPADDDNKVVVAFPKSGMGSVWNGKLFPAKPEGDEPEAVEDQMIVDSVTSPNRLKYLDLDRWSRDVFNIEPN